MLILIQPKLFQCFGRYGGCDMAYTGNRYDFDFFDYSYDTIQRMSDKVLRENYSRLRSVAVKRLNRLEKAEKFISESKFTQNWDKSDFPKLKDIERKSDLIKTLSDTMRFLSAKSSMVSGQKDIRDRKIKTLQEKGYKVNKSNFESFVASVIKAKEEQGDFYILAF